MMPLSLLKLMHVGHDLRIYVFHELLFTLEAALVFYSILLVDERRFMRMKLAVARSSSYHEVLSPCLAALL